MRDAVAAGTLPPLAERLPETPSLDALDRAWQSPGRYGGRLRMMMAKVRDLRQMTVYGYARLVGYTPDLTLEPDLLLKVENQEDRVFTLHLRPGHRWSDGAPFTSADFRYWWEDVANNKELSPTGPPVALVVKGELPTVTYPDATTVRYAWSNPNPQFLHDLARARPLYLYRPAHYLKGFHIAYSDPEVLQKKADKARLRNWAALHNRYDNLFRNDNPDLPTLQPWVNSTKPPSERFVFKRNPFFHRVDPQGRQLPYIDKVVVQMASSGLVPPKTGSGDTDLQARYLRFDNYTFLKEAEKKGQIAVDLWRTARGARLALYLNLNVKDPIYRQLFQDVRVRRALSLAIDRFEINQVVFYGLASEGNNTVLADSPLFRPEYQTTWAQHDIDAANALLDEVGLNRTEDDDYRLLDGGRTFEIIVETAGESTEESDVLQLIRDSWRKIGVALYTKPSQREVFRNRIYSGETQAAIWTGLENALPDASMSPDELAPTRQSNLQWPRWGQYVETKGQAGVAPDLPVAQELMSLYEDWRETSDLRERAEIWHRMLSIHADNVLSIGLIANVPQPVVFNPKLRNLPKQGLYNWHPGSFFGIYRPDSFWFAEEGE